MTGRYGTDDLNKALTTAYFVLLIISIFTKGVAKLVFSLLWALLFALALFRMLSKNIYKRLAENRKYLAITAKLKSKITLYKSMWRDRNTHVYKKCPHCKAVIRLPKKHGEHSVDCPKCRREFKVKI